MPVTARPCAAPMGGAEHTAQFQTVRVSASTWQTSTESVPRSLTTPMVNIQSQLCTNLTLPMSRLNAEHGLENTVGKWEEKGTLRCRALD